MLQGRVVKKLFITLLFVMLGCPVFAYIDPGTGSMLLSVVIGASTALFFLLNSLFISLKRFVFAKKDLSDNSVPFAIYSEGKQYFGVFKPILDEFERREIPVLFLTSDENDPIFNENYRFVTGKFIGKGSKAYMNLAFLRADVCLMTTPQLDVLQLKRSKFVKHYSHIFHSITASMDYRLFSLDYYDSVLCDAQFQIPLIRELEKKRNLTPKELVVVGSTYMDYYSQQLKNTSLRNPTPPPYKILVAPSWGADSLLNKFGNNLLQKLAETDYKIIVRPHPQSMLVEKDLINNLMQKFPQFEWNFDANNLEVLSRADVMISDFSCVMFDYAFLFKRPFIFVNTEMNMEIYDMGDLDELPWRYRMMYEIGRELKLQNIDMLPQLIEETKHIDVQKIEAAKQLAWEKEGESAQNIVDFLINKQKEVSEC